MFHSFDRPARPKAVDVEARGAQTATKDTGYTWRLTPDKVNFVAQPDPLAEDQTITSSWIPPEIRTIENEYPMSLHIVYEWRDSHLKGSPFQGDIGRHVVVGHVDRYFLIHTTTSRDTSVDELVQRYTAAIHRSDRDETLVWPDLLSRKKAIALAVAIHRKECGREELQEGDRVLLLVPNIHYLGQDKMAAF
ncbi:hypothetical protein KKA01_02010 [Patescibacteria group bacterium]|nr:hypothetical protein [Patescibacteria group bacterium]